MDNLINNIYTNMQINEYNKMSSGWSIDRRDEIVGSFDAHNNWTDYELLFKNISNTNEKTCLDFGCGPGRNIVKYYNTFKIFCYIF